MNLLWVWEVSPDSPVQERADKAIHDALEKKEGRWLAGEATTSSRSQIQRLIDEGHVTINGLPIKAKTRIQPGDRVEVQFPEPKPTELIPEDRPLDILYQDEYLLVVNKPPGLTVHPSPTQMEGTLVHALLHHIKDLSGIGGVLRPGIVHRIDKDTSGALVITKTDAAHTALSEIFSKHDIERSYWALCYGSPSPDKRKGRLESLIGRHPTDRKKMSMQVKVGRNAVTHYQVLEEYQNSKSPFASLIEAKLETGRTHQVRVHLTSLGCSLLGDPVYGVPSERHTKWLALPEPLRKRVETLPGQALHARVLGFKHPITGQPMRFEAEPPPEFKAVLEELRQSLSWTSSKRTTPKGLG